jgi:hypothetical protein
MYRKWIEMSINEQFEGFQFVSEKLFFPLYK